MTLVQSEITALGWNEKRTWRNAAAPLKGNQSKKSVDGVVNPGKYAPITTPSCVGGQRRSLKDEKIWPLPGQIQPNCDQMRPGRPQADRLQRRQSRGLGQEQRISLEKKHGTNLSSGWHYTQPRQQGAAALSPSHRIRSRIVQFRPQSEKKTVTGPFLYPKMYT